MEFGLILTQFTDRWDHVMGDALAAERLGLDSVWLADHLFGSMGPEHDIFEAWVSLSAVAGATERIRLGHLVNCVSFRNVGLLAKMAATLDHASKGRLELGLGAGWYEAEYEAFGYRFHSPGDRRRYFEEYLDALLQLLRGEVVDHEGEFLTLRGATCRPGPYQEPHPPIVIGTGRPRMMEIAARKADAWNVPASLIGSLDEMRDKLMADAGGRSVRTTLQIPVAVGRDREEAAAAVETGKVHMAWMGDVEKTGIHGIVDEAAEQVVALADRGVDGLVAAVPGTRRRPDYIEAYAALAARFAD